MSAKLEWFWVHFLVKQDDGTWLPSSHPINVHPLIFLRDERDSRVNGGDVVLVSWQPLSLREYKQAKAAMK